IAPLIARSGKNARRRRSLWSELVRIALGGLFGAILAQLVLWWLPAPYRRDPLGLAPRLPEALALLAPEDLRAPAADNNVGQGDNDDGDHLADEQPAPSADPLQPPPGMQQSRGLAMGR